MEQDGRIALFDILIVHQVGIPHSLPKKSISPILGIARTTRSNFVEDYAFGPRCGNGDGHLEQQEFLLALQQFRGQKSDY